MKKMIKWLALSCCSLIAASSLTHATEYKIGGWSIDRVTDEKGSVGCTMTGTYTGGIHLAITLLTNSEFGLAIGSKHWNFKEGATQRVVLAFDDRQVFDSVAVAVDSQMLWIVLKNSTAIAEAIKRRNKLQIRTSTGVESFPLTDTSKGIDFLIKCVNNAIAEHNRTAKSANTFAKLSAKPGSEASQPQVIVLPRDKMLVFVINWLSAAHIEGFKILPADENEPDVISWSTPDGGFGSFVAVRTLGEAAIPAKYSAQGAIQDDAQACKGKFVTTKKGGETAKGISANLVYTICEDGEQSFARLYTFIGLGQGTQIRIAQWQTGLEAPEEIEQTDQGLYQDADWSKLQ